MILRLKRKKWITIPSVIPIESKLVIQLFLFYCMLFLVIFSYNVYLHDNNIMIFVAFPYCGIQNTDSETYNLNNDKLSIIR